MKARYTGTDALSWIFALRYLLEMQTKEQSVVYYRYQFIAY